MSRPLCNLLLVLVAASGALLCGSCGQPQRATELDQAVTSSERIAAITRIARERDAGQLRELVRQLSSSDIVVRWTAIETLRELTGEDLGYRHDDPETDRAAAIRLWIEAIESDGLDMADPQTGFRADAPDRSTSKQPCSPVAIGNRNIVHGAP